MLAPESTSEHFFQTFGPRASKATGARLDPGSVPDRAVKTHCCFCGQQCGITLLVKDETVIGFEPRYDFPFNQGKLCPKDTLARPWRQPLISGSVTIHNR